MSKKVGSRLSAREQLANVCRSNELPFPKPEFRARLKRIQKSMREDGIDLLFLSAPESMFYICGYRAEWYQAQSPRQWPPASGIAVPSDGDRFILFDIDDEELMDRSETVAPDIRIYWDSSIRMTDWIIGELHEEGLLKGVIGLEIQSYRPNRMVSEGFQRGLERHGVRVVDATDVVRNIRSVKSDKEIECVKKAAMIADIGMKAAIDSIGPGMTELQVYGEVIRAMAYAGGENPAITIPVISGPRSARGHALASRRKICKGDIVNIDICGVFNRYHSNMSRTFSIGRPPREVLNLLEISAGSFVVLREMLRPGMPIHDFVEAMSSYYHGAGVEQNLMWFGGYDLGIGFPPDWVGTFVYDKVNYCQGRAFIPGTVVNYESNFYLPRKAGASLLINTIVFGRKRVQTLGRTPDDLIVI
jgi:Xaa-Pro aminopeptidase